MKGLQFMLKGSTKFLGPLFSKMAWLLPRGMAGIFLLITIGRDLYTLGATKALENFLYHVFAASQTINEIIDLAAANDPQYTLGALFSLISSMFIIYYVIKYVRWGIDRVFALNPNIWSIIAGVVFIMVAEWIVAIVQTKTLFGGYTPIWAVALNLIAHLPALWQNLYVFSWQPFGGPVQSAVSAVNDTQPINSTNSSI